MIFCCRFRQRHADAYDAAKICYAAAAATCCRATADAATPFDTYADAATRYAASHCHYADAAAAADITAAA